MMLHEACRLLRSLGVPEELILRATRLVKRVQIVYEDENRMVLLVPSQRLEHLPREKMHSFIDLKTLLEEGRYAITVARTGKLPIDQQWYQVVLTRNGSSCTCPYTKIRRARICVHRVAALIVAAMRNRLDLVSWVKSISQRSESKALVRS